MTDTNIKKGDVVFLDGSSTTQYMGRFIAPKKGITAVTCNILLADFLSEHGINTYCTGGRIVEHPGILGGNFMPDMLSKFNIDIAFFSSTAFDSSGKIISLGEGGVRNHQAFRKYSNKLVYLCGSDKFDAEGEFVSLTLSDVDYFISDKNLPEDLKCKFKTTKFICTN